MTDKNNFYIRELEIDDYDKGFLECLKELTEVGNISKNLFSDTFIARKSKGIFTAVVVDDESQQILGTGSIFFEQKFIRNCSIKGYIEDVSVSKAAQKRGIGRSIVEYLIHKALKTQGCYKVVLTCNSNNTCFYEKLKFKKIEDAMAINTKDFR